MLMEFCPIITKLFGPMQFFDATYLMWGLVLTSIYILMLYWFAKLKLKSDFILMVGNFIIGFVVWPFWITGFLGLAILLSIFWVLNQTGDRIMKQIDG